MNAPSPSPPPPPPPPPSSPPLLSRLFAAERGTCIPHSERAWKGGSAGVGVGGGGGGGVGGGAEQHRRDIGVGAVYLAVAARIGYFGAL